MVEFGLVPEKARIRASIEKGSGRVPWKVVSTPESENGRISVSTEKCKNPGEYREKVESEKVSKNFSDKYRKWVESVWLP